MGRFRGSIVLKAALLGLSFPLFLGGNARAGVCSEAESAPYIENLGSTNENVRNAAFTIVEECGAAAVPALIEALKDDDADVRSSAADVLGNIGAEAKAAVPALIEALKDDDADVRSSTAYALGNIGAEAKAAVPALVEALEDDDADVRSGAAYALGNIGAEAKAAVPALVEALKDDDADVRSSTAYALGKIGYALDKIGADTKAVASALIEALKDDDADVRSSAADVLAALSLSLLATNQHLSDSDLEQTIKNLSAALMALKEGSADSFTEARIRAVSASLSELQGELEFRRLRTMFSRGWVVHAAFWFALIFVYPKSPQIQAIFFWNPWVRKIAGLGYVGFALTRVPFLRMKLFEPFRESLLADAHLENFNPQAYFAGSEVKQLWSGQMQPIWQALPSVKGQSVLEGSSGLGKTMFLRQLVRRSQRVVVYLPAEKCTKGVIEAIQAKLHGEVIKDSVFLQNLIYSGAIDVCIDGLNEVSADTRAKIVEFTENYFKVNIILATQLMKWQPPLTAKCWVMQPLRTEQIREFLVSREPLIPAEAPVLGAAYVEACDRYLAATLSGESIEELTAAQRILSNPMDLTVVASMLAAGKQPDLFRLQEKQYQVMATEYEAKHLQQ